MAIANMIGINESINMTDNKLISSKSIISRSHNVHRNQEHLHNDLLSYKHIKYNFIVFQQNIRCLYNK